MFLTFNPNPNPNPNPNLSQVTVLNTSDGPLHPGDLVEWYVRRGCACNL